MKSQTKAIVGGFLLVFASITLALAWVTLSSGVLWFTIAGFMMFFHFIVFSFVGLILPVVVGLCLLLISLSLTLLIGFLDL